MPSITIDFIQEHADIIAVLASKTGRTNKEYIEWVVGQHAAGQVKGYFASKIRDLSIAELIDLFGSIE